MIKSTKLPSVPTILFFAGVLWTLYFIAVLSSGTCKDFILEKEGQWYVYYPVSESDETGGSIHFNERRAGPISKSEAEQIVSDCTDESQSWMYSYGTIFRFIEDKDEDGRFYYEMIISLGPLVILWLIALLYKRYQKKREILNNSKL
jgi:hypothetical protein